MADWNDTLQKGLQYIKGEKVLGVDKSNSKKAKVNDCVYTNFEYTTMYVRPCNGIESCLDVIFTLHRDTQMICNGDSSSYTTQNQFGYTTYYSNNANYWPAYSNTQYSYPSYNVANVAYGIGSDRNYWNNRLSNACDALGFKAGVTGLTWDSAEAVARAMGARLTEFRTPQGALTQEAKDLFASLGKIGRKIGFVGLAFDSVQFGLGFFDGNDWGNDDTKNLVMLTLGVAGLIAGGWTAVIIGGITIYVQIKN